MRRWAGAFTGSGCEPVFGKQIAAIQTECRMIKINERLLPACGQQTASTRRSFLPLCGRSSPSPRSRLLIGPSGCCWRRPDRPAEPSCCFSLSAAFGICVSRGLPSITRLREGNRPCLSADHRGRMWDPPTMKFGRGRAAVAAAPARPEQRHVALAGGDRRYGGARTGPRTPARLQRIVKARTVHGAYGAEMRELRRLMRAPDEKQRRLLELAE